MDLKKLEFVLMVLCFFISAFLLIENMQMTGFSIFDKETSSPQDFLNEKNIEVYNEKIILHLENYTIYKYNFSESMLPLFGENSNCIGIKPNSEEDIHIGDIIIFREGENLIAHRVVEKGFDDKGLFFISKGDNNKLKDSKVRFENIESVVVAIIY